MSSGIYFAGREISAWAPRCTVHAIYTIRFLWLHLTIYSWFKVARNSFQHFPSKSYSLTGHCNQSLSINATILVSEKSENQKNQKVLGSAGNGLIIIITFLFSPRIQMCLFLWSRVSRVTRWPLPALPAAPYHPDCIYLVLQCQGDDLRAHGMPRQLLLGQRGFDANWAQEERWFLWPILVIHFRSSRKCGRF